MRLDMRLVDGAGMNDRLDLEIAHRARHACAVGDGADDAGRGGRDQGDDLMAVALQAETSVWPSQPEEPVRRMRMGLSVGVR